MEEEKVDLKRVSKIIVIVFCVAIAAIAIIWGACALSSIYSVWSSAKSGEAELAQADYNRQIAVREAAAKMDSAKDLAQAEIIRAQGLAQANKILGQSLTGSEGDAYLHYLWLQDLGNTKNQVIYIPTEANMPINEAGRSVK